MSRVTFITLMLFVLISQSCASDASSEDTADSSAVLPTTVDSLKDGEKDKESHTKIIDKSVGDFKDLSLISVAGETDCFSGFHYTLKTKTTCSTLENNWQLVHGIEDINFQGMNIPNKLFNAMGYLRDELLSGSDVADYYITYGLDGAENIVAIIYPFSSTRDMLAISTDKYMVIVLTELAGPCPDICK